MSIALVTGSGGLIGAEAVLFLARQGLTVYGIDNDMRAYFFGDNASTNWRIRDLENRCPGYRHRSIDIRDGEAIDALFQEIGSELSCVIHAAAQPSHDWAAKEPVTDFSINALGTLNLLEALRKHAPDAAFAFLSTNKVYGDRPNALPLVETETRWEIDASHVFHDRGIDETMSIDGCMHSIFGVSKASADLMVQEYGRYFGLKTACFRGGCLTGAGHSGAELHGFLAYLMQCTVTGKPYTVFGYKAKQVRDNIHSSDLVQALWRFVQAPTSAAVYNIGGGRFSSCSMLEAIDLCQKRAGRELNWTYSDDNRAGDHIWWISDISKFQADYPGFELQYDIEAVIADLHDNGAERWEALAS
ncbi:NAD-dependent epimerase/dehydratase family protein [Roseibium sp.]|uniref:NAD-dependent epimerase/dehydratase family protein n=1 Tax=Roseibium sp. TaxID=1936156 RepID=UPI0039EECDA0